MWTMNCFAGSHTSRLNAGSNLKNVSIMKSISGNHLITFFFLGLLTSGVTYGQNINIKIGLNDSIQSAILKENKRLSIHLPGDYDNSTIKYPVLYLLDGSAENLLHTMSAMNKLQAYQQLPDMIVVAMANTDRDRDRMPLSTKSCTELCAIAGPV